MIRKLEVEGVTVFPQKTAFEFVPGINIIVGDNDSGKTHLMKLSYALSKWSEKSLRREFPETWAEEERLHRHLLRAYGTQALASLASRYRQSEQARVHASLTGEKAPLGCCEVEFDFHPDKESEELHITTMPQRFLQENALFIPPHETLTLYPYYSQQGKRNPDMPDALSRELCRALDTEQTGEEPQELRSVMRLIEHMLQGKLIRHNARFLLKRRNEQPMELSMVAEGFKRIGTIGLLIGNGTLRPGTSLFWDEPEMNLNTAQLPLLGGIMMGLCQAGVQLMITTHSLFLLRELVIRLNQTENRSVTRRFIGLQAPPTPYGAVQVTAGSSPHDIGPLDCLKAEMEQADRYLCLSDIANYQ